jgi:hypothetical protein
VAVFALVVLAPAARGDLFIRFQPVTVFSDNVNPVSGELLLYLELTEPELSSPPNISSFNIDFSVTSGGAGLTFSAPQAATASPLFTGGFFSPNGTYPGQHVQAFHDIMTEMPDTVPAVNGAGLLKVPFSVAGGNVGNSFTLTLNTVFTEIANAVGAPYAYTPTVGTINVAAIPEAAGWKAVGLVALMSTVVTLIVRRRKVAIA